MIVCGTELEAHEVQTQDGYLLTLFRILQPDTCPNGQNYVNKTPKPETVPTKGEGDLVGKWPSKEAVLFVGGLNSCGLEWLLNTKEKCLPNMLVAEEYDCFLACLRGSPYSKRHLSLKTNSREYWDFSADELGMYDIPAIIDHILEVTGNASLTYVGHSLGCAALFMNASLNPGRDTKIKSMIALAPAIYGHHNRTKLIKLGLPLAGPMSKIKFIYRRDVCAKTCVGYANMMCPPFRNPQKIGTRIMRKLGKWLDIMGNTDQIEKERRPTLAEYTPGSTSFKIVMHVGQVIASGKFQQYDHGRSENVKRYGQSKPAIYDLKTVTFPVATMTSKHDLLVRCEDVAKVAEDLPNLISHKEINFPQCKFTHADFLFGRDAPTLVYDDVVEIIKRFSYGDIKL